MIPRQRYTPGELNAAQIADNRADLAFSIRNDPDTTEWVLYRQELRRQIAALLRAARMNKKKKGDAR